jgi:hypothetical protein
MTVQVRDGKVLISDGPFAETKEQIGGYCLIDCRVVALGHGRQEGVAWELPGGDRRGDPAAPVFAWLPPAAEGSGRPT